MTIPNVDSAEIAKFSRFSAHWWDPNGALKTLHDINPLRLKYVNEKASLKDKMVLDIGCGGGLLTEAMAKLQAHVTGIDMSEEALNVAKLHQHESGLKIEYILTPAEKLAEERPAQFDIVTCMEMLEHVPDPLAIIEACAQLVKPGGHVFISTLNRNLKSYVFAILGAEYIAKILPKGTHDYAKFIRPSELDAWARKAGFHITDMIGLQYSIMTKQFILNDDVSINYIAHLRSMNGPN
jgi:2-polyprenyl-6-hydroxyphenyl methylase/3-demethylubiquinone-9 3-methyltransferase